MEHIMLHLVNWMTEEWLRWVLDAFVARTPNFCVASYWTYLTLARGNMVGDWNHPRARLSLSLSSRLLLYVQVKGFRSRIHGAKVLFWLNLHVSCIIFTTLRKIYALDPCMPQWSTGLSWTLCEHTIEIKSWHSNPKVYNVTFGTGSRFLVIQSNPFFLLRSLHHITRSHCCF